MIDWRKKKDEFSYLKAIPFPALGKRPHVDMLIGSDCIEVHRALMEVIGMPGQPIARLTPLGWTCVGRLVKGTSMGSESFVTQTFFAKGDLDQQLQRFWESEEIMDTGPIMSTHDKHIFEKSKEHLIQEDGRFSVRIPWNEKKHQLLGNVGLALNAF